MCVCVYPNFFLSQYVGRNVTGDFPSTRCGSSLVLYKNKALLFGGVFDEEGEWIQLQYICL